MAGSEAERWWGAVPRTISEVSDGPVIMAGSGEGADGYDDGLSQVTVVT